jgi:hypothetical protein
MNTLIELLDAFAGADGRVDRLVTYNAVHKGIEALKAEVEQFRLLAKANAEALGAALAERDALRAELDALKSQKPVAWADAEAISNLPTVDEAIRALLDDQTGDNATALVQAFLEAAPQAPAPERNYLQDIAACIGVGGYNGANDQQLYERICDEFARVTAPQAPAHTHCAQCNTPNSCGSDSKCLEQYITARLAAPQAPAPLTEQQRKTLWHGCTEAHSQWGSYSWFCHGIRSAEKAHGITGEAQG